MSKNNQITNHEITGDIVGSPKQFSLYEMVGLNVNPYGKLTLDDYKEKIREMTFADLQDHAVNQAGVIPVDDRERLEKKLVAQFLQTTGQLQANAIQRKESEEQMVASKRKSHLSKEQQRQVTELLSRGR